MLMAKSSLKRERERVQAVREAALIARVGMHHASHCSICRQHKPLSNDRIILSCNHPFCRACLRPHLARVGKCPDCRAAVTLADRRQAEIRT